MRLAVPATDPMLGYVARTGVFVSVEDASIDPRFNVDLVNILLLSVVAAPVQQGIISRSTFPMGNSADVHSSQQHNPQQIRTHR